MTIPGIQRLYKAFCLFLCLNTYAYASDHQQELRNCKDALIAQINKQGRIPTANCPVSDKLVYWLGILRDPSQFTAKELIAFLDKHPHWPQHEKLCCKAEEVIVAQASQRELLQWFNKYPPQTAPSVIAYGKALLATEKQTKAKSVIKEAWLVLDFSDGEEKQFLQAFGNLLGMDDHIQRLENLLWDEKWAEARKVMSYVPKNTQNLAHARMAVIQGKSVIPHLSKEQLKTEGIYFAKAKVHKKAKAFDAAAQLIITAPISSRRAENWWDLQNYVAREMISEKKYAKAYQIASKHKLKPGTENYANAQWLCGWLTLRFLNKPNTAAKHFEQLYANVNSALSRSRAAYWVGRTYETKGQVTTAQTWYKRAAQLPTTYYGQLAAAKIRLKPYPVLAVASKVPVDIKKKLNQHEFVKAVHILKGLGNAASHEVTKFLFHLADNVKTKHEREFVLDLAHQHSRDDVVWVAKKAGFEQPITLKKAFPVCIIPQRGQIIPEKALVMSIAYQESRFNPTAQSSAGAIGLMQLMPKTAARVAKLLRVAHHERKLYDPTHNLHLGSSHLSTLLDKFDSSYILTIAAYNAGDEPVKRWLHTFGDPRKGEVDIVDWVELIPYGETRNYVMRVLENITIYRSLEGNPKTTLVDDLKR